MYKNKLQAFPNSSCTHHKIVFHHEIYNEEGTLLNTGDVTLYFMNAGEMKRCEMPAVLKEKLVEYFDK